MWHIIIKWFIYAIAVLLSSMLLSGVTVAGFGTSLLVAFILGIVNIFIKPVLVILTLPINIITLGLFTLVINALMIMLVAAIVPGFKVNNFWWALLYGIVLSIVVYIMDKIIK